jgi:hypothetical protein
VKTTYSEALLEEETEAYFWQDNVPVDTTENSMWPL